MVWVYYRQWAVQRKAVFKCSTAMGMFVWVSSVTKSPPEFLIYHLRCVLIQASCLPYKVQ